MTGKQLSNDSAFQIAHRCVNLKLVDQKLEKLIEVKDSIQPLVWQDQSYRHRLTDNIFMGIQRISKIIKDLELVLIY